MKSPLITFVLLMTACTVFAQVSVDSLTQQLPQLPDSAVMASLQKVEAIRSDFNTKADSLKNQYQASISKIDEAGDKLNRAVDSLNHLKLPANKHLQKLDSLNKVREKTIQDFSAKAEALKAKTTGKLKQLELPPQISDKVQGITQKIDGFDLKSDFVNIPALDVPGFSLPKIDGLGDLTGQVKGLGALPKIETPMGDLNQVTGQVQGLQGDVKSITEGNLNDVKQLPKTLEDQAAKMEGVQELQKTSGVIDEYKDKLEPLKNPEAGKEKVVEIAKKAAVDHFAGKDQQLKAAMEKMSKYKQKYSSVSSIKDLPKRPPNAMKGKPFVERLIPGMYFQYQRKGAYLIDVNPYASYRLTGRFTVGLGWNQRFAYDDRANQWDSRKRIFGPRAHVDFRMAKGFIAHLETEAMNSFVPSTLVGNPDTGERQWVWGMMTGLKKEYRIYRNLKGTALIQYNIFNPHYKAPYADRFNSRIGFEYVLKKKSKK